jgi:hypothetical protein
VIPRLTGLGSRMRHPALLVVTAVAVAMTTLGSGSVTTLAVAPTPVPTPVPTPAPTPIPAFKPGVIALPTLGVSAPVISVGVESDGAMGTPGNARDIAWWKGIRPGEGNALFAGHVSYSGRIGTFNRLKDLKPGDEVKISGEGRALKFKVAWVKQVDGDSDPSEMFARQPVPVVTLITCGGAFDTSIRHHVDRVVVRAVLA